MDISKAINIIFSELTEDQYVDFCLELVNLLPGQFACLEDAKEHIASQEFKSILELAQKHDLEGHSYIDLLKLKFATPKTKEVINSISSTFLHDTFTSFKSYTSTLDSNISSHIEQLLDVNDEEGIIAYAEKHKLEDHAYIAILTLRVAVN